MRGVGIVAVLALAACSVPVPEYGPPAQVRWLDQGWSEAERTRYHHTDQGTLTFGVPLEWFKALEQPQPGSGADMLADQRYLDRFGFIPSASGPSSGGPGLPVGFATGGPALKPDTLAPWTNPATAAPFTAMGLTCAACHTGRFTYQGREVLVDGAGGLLNLGQFAKALGLSLFSTSVEAARWRRFSDRVVGREAPDEARDALRRQMGEVLARLGWQAEQDKRHAGTSVEEGFARLDALNRIGNQVFATTPRIAANYAAISAPVNFPHIWTASWFDWVQYNSSIQQPMVRNAGEALGVAAPVNLGAGAGALLTATVPVEKLYWMEQLLAGKPPVPGKLQRLPGLQAPAWPAGVFPPIDQARAAVGATLYAELCQRCHLPPPNTAAFWQSENWARIGGGQHVLRLKTVPLAVVGTDPAQAEDMRAREVATGPTLGIATRSFGGALGALVEKTVNRWYDTRTPPTPAAARERINGYRPNGIRADVNGQLVYKARPLNGIWATAPFLHNGSVPTLYALLSPEAERPPLFHLGNREYDPVDVGYRTTPIAGDFALDTTLRGNRNTGHAFDNGPPRPGRIGRGLTPEERRSLIEFLKTL